MQDANGSYRPNDNVTRGEFASYLSKVLKLGANDGKIFTDVPDTYMYLADIQLAATAGIITGYADGTFKPDAAISRQHMAIMLERAIDFLKIPKVLLRLRLRIMQRLLRTTAQRWQLVLI